MRNYIYVLHAKHGDLYSFSALGLLRYQLEAEYRWIDDFEFVSRANRAATYQDEIAAWELLQERDCWEYENVSREEVLD